MGTEKILFHVALHPEVNKTTGYTRHVVDGQPYLQSHQLKIAKFEDDDGYYLYYCDEAGDEVTDTYHESIEGAFEQARLEFSVVREAWREQ